MTGELLHLGAKVRGNESSSYQVGEGVNRMRRNGKR